MNFDASLKIQPQPVRGGS